MTTNIVFTSPFPAISIPDVSLHDLIRSRAREFGDRTALVEANSGATISYSELDERIGQVASGLVAHGLEKGDVVALMSPNCVEWPIAALGIMAAGGVVSPVNPLYKGRELAHQLANSGATRAIAFVLSVGEIHAVADEAGIEEIFVLHGDEGGIPFADILDHPATPVDVRIDASDLASLPYSSGTTGLAKGVELTHGHIVAALHQSAAVLEIEDDDKILGFLPMFHIMGFSAVTMGSLFAGATVISVPMFEPVSFLTAIQQYRINKLIAVPPVINLLAHHPMVENFDLSSIEVLGSGAAPLGGDIERAAAERLGCQVGQGWGMTETSGGATMPALSSSGVDSRPGASGKLVPNCEAMIVDPVTGASLGPHETGELWVRGPNVFTKYRNNAEATAETVDVDGWLHTGDLCHFDDDEFLFVTDRLKELIKVKGFQVAPAELEALLLSHPAVADAAVIGRPDERSGEVPVAFVVLAEDIETEEIMAWVAEQVTDYKQLSEVLVRDDIPKNPSGKILRRVLRDELTSRV